MSHSVYRYDADLNNGKQISLSEFDGKVTLIVNTASACGFTPQYKGLQELYKKYSEQGFSVLAFPCNQFGKQEKGDDTEIRQFCDLSFNVSFPLFKKIEVNGDNVHPLYKQLKDDAPGILNTKGIKWNFTKFLVNRKGEVYKRYAPNTKPEAIEADIKQLLAE